MQWEVSPDSRDPRQRYTWKDRLTRLAAEGRLEREMLLDGCVKRFLRGGSANDLKWFVALHRALNPTVDEITTRVRDYVRLLPAAPGPVAELALGEIRRADDAAPLDDGLFTEAAEAVLFRPEKKLVRAALTWLDRTARKRGRTDRTVCALTVAFGHEALDLRERAVVVAVKHAPRAGHDARRAAADAAGVLPAELRARIAAAYGDVSEPAAPPPPVAAPPPFTPRELPPPISSPAELAEQIVAGRSGDLDWASLERLLAGLVAVTHAEPERTRAALERVVPEAVPWVYGDYPFLVDHPGTWLGLAIRAIVRPGRPQGLRGLLSTTRTAFVRDVIGAMEDRRKPVPHRIIQHRIRATPDAIGRCPVLLATPTAASGHIDPAELVARLRLLEKAAVDPATIDLEQALLRLPRDVDVDVIAATRQVATPAGKIMANWLAGGGLQDPTVTCATLSLPRLVNRALPPGSSEMPTSPRVLATVSARAASGLAAKLCRLPEAASWERADFGHYYGRLDWWPAVMPSHREVIAAHLLPHLVIRVEARDGQGAALLGLAEADGPAGAATATALAYGLGARHQAERTAAVDALLILAGRGQLPASDLGEAIATLAGHRVLKLNRVTAAMTDAARAGAYADTWTAIAAALPQLLPETSAKAPPGLPDLFALGTESVEATGIRGDIPKLAAVASRGGSSRLVREAVRLHRRCAGTRAR